MSTVHGPSPERPAPVIPGYEVLQLLGTGGMGKVYLARQTALKRNICVKILSVPEGENPDVCRLRFGREAELIARVSHPHILSVIEFGTTSDSNLPFLVTEHVEGGDLRQRMKGRKPWAIDRARTVILQVGEALEFLHGKGIIHRDLKPENILMATESLCKVCDFGLAVLRDSAGEITQGSGLGTIGYVSPEQQYGLKVDERTDQYALAALSYELLTGKRALGQFPAPSRLNPLLPQEIDRVILKGLASEPVERYATIREFLNQLEPHLVASRGRRMIKPIALGVLSMVLLVAALATTIRPYFWEGGEAGGKNPPARQNPDPPRDGAAGAELSDEPHPPSPESRSPEYDELVRRRAYRLWIEQGRPEGEAGDAVELSNWLNAERQVEAAVRLRAYFIWEKQGRPEGEEGKRMEPINRRTAEIELMKESDEGKGAQPRPDLP